MEKLTNKNFHFMNFVLAAKNWYEPDYGEKFSNFVLRLAKLEDKYLVFDLSNDNECIHLCNMCFDELANFYRKQGIIKYWDSFVNYANEVGKYQRLYNVDYADAVAHYLFSVLLHINGNEIELPTPFYGKGRPRLSLQQGMTYSYMNRKAEMFFHNWKQKYGD